METLKFSTAKEAAEEAAGRTGIPKGDFFFRSRPSLQPEILPKVLPSDDQVIQPDDEVINPVEAVQIYPEQE